MKRIPLLFIALFLFNVFSLAQTYKGKSIISVDLNKEIGKMDPVWAWFGYDEPNYTYQGPIEGCVVLCHDEAVGQILKLSICTRTLSSSP